MSLMYLIDKSGSTSDHVR